MKRLGRRQRAALALFIAFLVGSVGVAIADPQSADQPNVTVDVSPTNGQNLPDTATVQVTGAGFQSSGIGVSGFIVQAAELPNGTTALSGTLATFTSTSAGTFSETVQVTRTFTDAGSGETIDCNAAGVQCYVQATSNGGNFDSHHTISFASGGTTTSSTTSTSTTLPPTTTSSTTSTTVAPTTTSSTTSTTVAPTTTSSTTTSTTLPPTTTSSTTTSTTMAPTTTSSTTSTTMAPTTTSSTTSTTVAPTTTAPTTTTTVAPTTTTIGGGPTTTLGASQCAQLRTSRAALNAQIDAIRAQVLQSSLSAEQKAAVLAQLEAVRAQGNAQIDALLASCPAP